MSRLESSDTNVDEPYASKPLFISVKKAHDLLGMWEACGGATAPIAQLVRGNGCNGLYSAVKRVVKHGLR
jgi:hypothetical protein